MIKSAYPFIGLSLGDMERIHVLAHLDLYYGNKTATATVCNISVRTVDAKIKEDEDLKEKNRVNQEGYDRKQRELNQRWYGRPAEADKKVEVPEPPKELEFQMTSLEKKPGKK